MLLNSLRFAAFFATVFAVYYLLPHRFRKYILIAANITFCLSWGVQGTLTVFAAALFSFFAGLMVENATKFKKTVFLISVIVCIGNLFVFKYLNFAIDTAAKIASLFSFQFSIHELKILLPLGISYYTLQMISYLSDVFRGKMAAEKDLGAYLAFITFFPQITSGPISRAESVLPQLKEEKQFDYTKCNHAVKLIAIGLFKKLVVGDNLAPYVGELFGSVRSYTGFSLFIATVIYSIQLYGDFSGYSDIARGTAELLGITLPENFKAPYFSTTVQELWTRWHMSLSSWLRDYVYIPLGGSRKGKRRKMFNLLVTFCISGLWHGADISYVVWGAVHGVAQIAESIFGIHPVPLADNRCNKKAAFLTRLRRLLRSIYVYIIFCIGLFFFRADSVEDGFYILTHVLTGISSPASYISNGFLMNNWLHGGRLSFIIKFLICAVPLFLYDYYSLRFDVIDRVTAMKKPVRYLIYFSVIVLICFFRAVDGVSFVYFQF